MAKLKNPARLIVAPSDTDADMLYATRIFIGDPFIFLQQNGKRTLVLSDLEIDRAKKKAKADEFVMLSTLEREVQGKMEQAPPYEKVLAHFLTKRGVKRARVPANFPLGYANEIKRHGITLETTNGLFWPAREKKTAEEIKLLERALRITETGMKRGMEILKASRPGARSTISWLDLRSPTSNTRHRLRPRWWWTGSIAPGGSGTASSPVSVNSSATESN